MENIYSFWPVFFLLLANVFAFLLVLINQRLGREEIQQRFQDCSGTVRSDCNDLGLQLEVIEEKLKDISLKFEIWKHCHEGLERRLAITETRLEERHTDNPKPFVVRGRRSRRNSDPDVEV